MKYISRIFTVFLTSFIVLLHSEAQAHLTLWVNETPCGKVKSALITLHLVAPEVSLGKGIFLISNHPLRQGGAIELNSMFTSIDNWSRAERHREPLVTPVLIALKDDKSAVEITRILPDILKGNLLACQTGSMSGCPKEGRPNCWNGALVMSGILDEFQYTHEKKFNALIEHCHEKLIGENPALGDIGVMRVWVPMLDNSWILIESHAFVYLGNGNIFEKPGSGPLSPYRFTTFSQSLSTYMNLQALKTGLQRTGLSPLAFTTGTVINLGRTTNRDAKRLIQRFANDPSSEKAFRFYYSYYTCADYLETARAAAIAPSGELLSGPKYIDTVTPSHGERAGAE